MNRKTPSDTDAEGWYGTAALAKTARAQPNAPFGHRPAAWPEPALAAWRAIILAGNAKA